MRHEPYQFAMAGRNVGIHRADLLALLAGQLPPGTVRTGQRCTGFSQDEVSATACFADGSTATADVVIGADGIHSVLQGFVVAPAKPLYSGVVAYRGLVPRLAEYPAGTIRMWMGEGRHFLVFPVRAGELLNYVGFVSAIPRSASRGRRPATRRRWPRTSPGGTRLSGRSSPRSAGRAAAGSSGGCTTGCRCPGGAAGG